MCTAQMSPYGYLFVGLFAVKYWESIKGFIMGADISVS